MDPDHIDGGMRSIIFTLHPYFPFSSVRAVNKVKLRMGRKYSAEDRKLVSQNAVLLVETISITIVKEKGAK